MVVFDCLYQPFSAKQPSSMNEFAILTLLLPGCVTDHVPQFPQ